MGVEIITGDITKLNVDAIVNAANASLCGGGGVDGAIHRAAGKNLLEECRTLGGCKTGFAKMTSGFDLPAKYIIHTVGPVWYGGHKNEEPLLASCYRECFKLVSKHDLNSVAFPAISCGSYRFPMDKACNIALLETLKFLGSSEQDIRVIFVCFGPKNAAIYEQSLKTMAI